MELPRAATGATFKHASRVTAYTCQHLVGSTAGESASTSLRRHLFQCIMIFIGLASDSV